MQEAIARIRVELRDIRPLIWRRIDVPLSTTLLGLHDIIQVLMRWTGSHLFEFHVGDRMYGAPSPHFDLRETQVFKARSITLKEFVKRGVHEFLYLYDFGDDWHLDVMIEEIREGLSDIDYPSLVGGARRGPPEDVGGLLGFLHFVEVMANPLHAEHQDVVGWYGSEFEPEAFPEREIRNILGMFANRRRGPLMSHRSRRRSPLS